MFVLLLSTIALIYLLVQSGQHYMILTSISSSTIKGALIFLIAFTCCLKSSVNTSFTGNLEKS